MPDVKNEESTDEDSLPEISRILSSPRGKAPTLSRPPSVFSSGYKPSTDARTLSAVSNMTVESAGQLNVASNHISADIEKPTMRIAGESSKENSHGRSDELDEHVEEMWY